MAESSLAKYVEAAMKRAQYEILPEDGTYYGSIPGLLGVWANELTLEECRAELASVVEDWIELGLRLGDEIPEIDGIRVSPRK